jgi:hypothetical protein
MGNLGKVNVVNLTTFFVFYKPSSGTIGTESNTAVSIMTRASGKRVSVVAVRCRTVAHSIGQTPRVVSLLPGRIGHSEFLR